MRLWLQRVFTSASKRVEKRLKNIHEIPSWPLLPTSVGAFHAWVTPDGTPY
jgi:hypothetical protein